MVKSITLSFSLILLATFAFAQSAFAPHKAVTQIDKHRMFIQSLISSAHPPSCSTVAKATALADRVIAISDSGNLDDETMDSTTYAYSGNRGSAYDYNNMTYNTNSAFIYYPVFSYGSYVDKPLILCDTAREWFVNQNTNIYGLQLYGLYGYDGNNNMLYYKEAYLDSATFTNNHYMNSFDNNGNMIYSLLTQSNGTGGYDNNMERFYTYDGQNRITADSSYYYNNGAWQLTGTYTYIYTNNNLTEVDGAIPNGNTWEVNERYLISYTANNQIQRVEQDAANGGPLQVQAVDTFGYTSGVSFHTYWKELYNAGNTYLDSTLVERYHLNQQLLPDTVYTGRPSGNSSAPWAHYLDVATYNANNNPTSLRFYSYSDDMQSTTLEIATKYYYETYNNTGVTLTGINNIKVYPNPATDVLDIDLGNIAYAGVARLINTSGQYVAAASFAGNNAKLATHNLPAGLYWLLIMNSNGDVLYKQSIVKQ